MLLETRGLPKNSTTFTEGRKPPEPGQTNVYDEYQLEPPRVQMWSATPAYQVARPGMWRAFSRRVALGTLTMVPLEEIQQEQELLAGYRQLPESKQAEVREIVENMLDEEEDRRDILGGQRLVKALRAQQDAESEL
jgi:hypothetical protein